jgi:ribosomal protein S18 acetylase RimI-like enzyme
MRFVRLGSADLHDDTAPIVSWVVEAWKPYRDWLVGSRDRACAIAREWLARDTSELSITCVTSLLEGETHLGGYLAVSGEELPRRRKADLLWLLQRAHPEERRELAARLHESRGLFAPVEPRHLYLSKIGVLPEHRGRGLGGLLLEDYIRTGFDAGHEALRLDVSAGNEAALRLYRRHGFEATSEAELAPLGIRYIAMTLSRSAA